MNATTNGSPRPGPAPDGLPRDESRPGMNRFMDFVANALMSRQELLTSLLDRRRDIYDECGYPKGFVAAHVYQDLYDREAVPNRVVEVMALECWQVTPLVYEDESSDESTEFEKAWDLLGRQLRGEDSFYQDEAGSPIWEYLRRIDVLCGIGRYGVLLIGVEDGLPLDQPAGPAGEGDRKLLYLRCFPESLAQITKYESDPSSPRYQYPIEYNLTFTDPNAPSGGVGVVTATKAVHWTRVIHVCDGLGPSEVFGVPRMQAVLNRIMDLVKLLGGSAEMYWRGAFPGLALETQPQLGGDVNIDVAALRDTMENYMNGLQRYLQVTGMTAKTLSPTVVDPTSQITAQIQAICIKLGIPQRVFMGSERGELASSQDDQAWNDRVAERQANHVTPRVVVPFVDRLINLGVLPRPKGYSIFWPDITSKSDAEKASVALSNTNALAQYLSGGGEGVIQPADYLTGWLGFTDEEAEAWLEHTAAVNAGAEPADGGAGSLLGTKAGVEVLAQMFGMAKRGAISEEQLKQHIILFFKVDEKTADRIIAGGLTEAAESAGLKPPPPPTPPPGPGGAPNPAAPNPNRPGGRGVSRMSSRDNPGSAGPPVTPSTNAFDRALGILMNREYWETFDGWAPFDARPAAALNAFCPTGPGGGIDPTCSPKGAGRAGAAAKPDTKHKTRAGGVKAEATTPPPPPAGAAYTPKLTADHNRDGVTDFARVGVPADTIPPPPPIGRLPNLTRRERKVEKAFITAYEDDPDGVARKFAATVKSLTKPGDPPTFGTDDAKILTDAWTHPDPRVRSQNRATLNVALHQTANAIAKRAFVNHIDTLKPGDEILVTVGGCGAGKGYALKNVPEALEMKTRSKAVWDSAGDQNATENPWVQREAERRGLKVNYVYVHADPRKSWADPERGVVKRAADPNDGRMVDAYVFADSYALGARNHQAFMDKNADNPNANFIFIENIGRPRRIDGIPGKALRLNRKALAKFALNVVKKSDAPPHVKRGATIGERIWGES